MKTFISIVAVLAVSLLAIVFAGKVFDSPTDTGRDEHSLIRVTSPLPSGEIVSPLVVTGDARGQWYFEASFPVRLFDDNGVELAVGIATAEGEWMTPEFVPFSATLVFDKPNTEKGVLVFQKDNPSGMPEHDDEWRVPVVFGTPVDSGREVSLFYYNPELDKDASGNILCSTQGLVEVKRVLPTSLTPAQDLIRLLIRGELTPAERARGIETEFPLSGFSLVGANTSGRVLTLAFDDRENRTSGGSCRVSILWAQIEKTAMQFEAFHEVRFSPEDLFQP